MKAKIKKMGTNKDLEFLMKGWGNPETTEALSKAYGEKFNKEGEEDERSGEHSEESVSTEEKEKGVAVQEG
jgi:hypothetical protein